ncbi:hypothetical protein IFO70_06180 [Phormidium tenue FACHB-886]|nr:hypothetical protein [Phormidium tenue FACHB-886]
MTKQQLNSGIGKNRFAKFLAGKTKLQQTRSPLDHPKQERSPQSASGKLPISHASDIEASEVQASEVQASEVQASTQPSSPANDTASPAPTKAPASPPPPPDPRSKPWRWSLLWLAALGLFGGMGAAAVLWLVTLPPPIDCGSPAELTLDGERLYCAREAAQSGEQNKIIAGLNLVKRWDNDHPLQGEAKRLQEEWSKQLLRIARDKVLQSDLKSAIAILSHIPKTTETYAEAQEALAYWNKQWQAGEAIVAKAHAAMKQQRWNDAYQHITQFDDFSQDYWRITRAGALAQQLGAEKQAWQVFSQAKKAAVGGAAPQLTQAIVLAQQVPQKTFAEADARVQVQQWSQKLLGMGIEKWQQGDTTAAATLLQLPNNIKPSPELVDLLQFGNAYRLASQVNSRWLPSLPQIWNMTEAVAAIKQIKPDSPFYKQAKIHQQNWQAQLQDMIQLQYATTTASLGQRSSLQLAIAQAKEIGADRPRRRQAQTLISYWVDEIERMEDQPYLARAEALAKSGKVPDLQAAIAQASHIAKGRALRGRSQDLIATWRDQIEAIEDQPFLDQAVALASQGDLDAAIARATNIQSGRALYAKAQGLIADWQAQQIIKAQLAVDQPILERARAQARNGDLSAAINTASQIASGRALYNEAQGAIAGWRRAQEPIIPIEEPSLPDLDSYDLDVDPNSPDLPTDSPEESPFSADPEPLPSIDLVPPSPTAETSPEAPIDPEPVDPEPPIIVEPDPLPSDNPPPPPVEERSLRPRASYEGYYDERYYE